MPKEISRTIPMLRGLVALFLLILVVVVSHCGHKEGLQLITSMTLPNRQCMIKTPTLIPKWAAKGSLKREKRLAVILSIQSEILTTFRYGLRKPFLIYLREWKKSPIQMQVYEHWLEKLKRVYSNVLMTVLLLILLLPLLKWLMSQQLIKPINCYPMWSSLPRMQAVSIKLSSTD